MEETEIGGVVEGRERWVESRRGRKKEGKKERKVNQGYWGYLKFRNHSAGGLCHIPPPLVEIWPMSPNYIRRMVFRVS